jgi:hypothetical protein
MENPRIKVIYKVFESGNNEESMSPSRDSHKKEELQGGNTIISKMGNKTYESEEIAKKRKLLELKKEIEQKRREVME